MFRFKEFAFLLSCLNGVVTAANVESCPGYTASKVVHTGSGLTAKLKLGGKACNAYGTDLKELHLKVEYETGLSHSGNSLSSTLMDLQIPDSMSKFLILRCKFTRFPIRYCLDPHQRALMPNHLRLSSLGQKTPFPSPSLAVKRRSSIALGLSSSSNPNTCV